MCKIKPLIPLCVVYTLILSTTHSPLFPQQFSSKVLTLKTTGYEIEMKVDYESEKIFGRCLLTV